jgi:hypothetical protein
MQNQNVLAIIDKYLADWADKGLNLIPAKKVMPEMADPSQTTNDEWRRWFPIQSKVTDDEIDELETTIGYSLPKSYRAFLKHKHFYELHIGQASFCSHPADSWQSALTNLIFDSYPREFLVDKGYIPFAVWSDWGMLCFNTHKCDAHESAIVLWDHECWDEFMPFAPDFNSLVIKLDEEAAKNSN